MDLNQTTAMGEETPDQVSSTDNDESQSEKTPEVKIFTQKQVDKILNKRLKEVEAKYADYAALKEEVETFKAKVKEVSEKAKNAEQTVKDTKRVMSIELASKELNFPVDLANKLLEPSEFIVSEDGTITNIKDLILKVISLYPQLVRKASPDTVQPSYQLETTPSKKYSISPVAKSSFFNGSGLIRN